MTKQEAFEGLVDAIQAYNDELTDVQNALSYLDEVTEPSDIDEAKDGVDTPSNYDIPDTSDLVNLLDALNDAIQDFEDASEGFKATVSFTLTNIEVETQDDANDLIMDAIESSFAEDTVQDLSVIITPL